MYVRDSVYDALKILVKISRDAQDRSYEQNVKKSHMSPISWIKEYCTVRASTARCGGHTTSVLKLMTENDMRIGFLTRTMWMIEEFQRLYSHEKVDRGYLEFCESINSCCGESGIKFGEKKFPHLDAVVVDASFMLSKSQEDSVYRLASELQLNKEDTNSPFFLIFLQ